MTATEAYAFIRNLLGEESSTGTYRDAVLLPLLNEANHELWLELARDAPERCSTTQELTYTAGAASMTIGGSGEKVLTILYVGRKNSSGVVTASNPPTPIFPEQAQEIEQMTGLSRWPFYEGISVDERYAFVGDQTLMLRPIPSVAAYLHIRYIKDTADLTGGSDKLLGDLLTPAHRLVCMRAAQYAMQRNGRDAEVLIAMERRAWDTLLPMLQHQRHMPLEIRNVYDPD